MTNEDAQVLCVFYPDGTHLADFLAPPAAPVPEYLCTDGPGEPAHFALSLAGHFVYAGPCREAIHHDDGPAGVMVTRPDPDPAPPTAATPQLWPLIFGVVALTVATILLGRFISAWAGSLAP